MEKLADSERARQEVPSVDTVSVQGSGICAETAKKGLLIGGIVTIGLIVCIGLCIIIFGRGIFAMATEREDLKQVIDSYMRAMADKDAMLAYSLFSSRVKQHVSLGEVERLLEDSTFVLFDGYESLQIQTLNISSVHNTDPKSPQGTVARVNGSVTYVDGYVGRFHATLENENGEWKLDRVRVQAPAGKFDSYLGGE